LQKLTKNQLFLQRSQEVRSKILFSVRSQIYDVDYHFAVNIISLMSDGFK